jgi:hypothetical protein
MAYTRQAVVSGALTVALAVLGSTQGLAIAGLAYHALPGAAVAPVALVLLCAAFVATLTLNWARRNPLDAIACLFGTTGLLSWSCLLMVSVLPVDVAPWVAAGFLPVLLMALFSPVFIVSVEGIGFAGPAALALATWEVHHHLPGVEGPGVVFLSFAVAVLIHFPLFQDFIRSIWAIPTFQWVRWTVDTPSWERFVQDSGAIVDPDWPLEYQNGLSLSAGHPNNTLNKPRWEPVLVHTHTQMDWGRSESIDATINARFARAFPFAQAPKGPPKPIQVSHSAHAVLARRAARSAT